jgi:hypothetical protein
VVFKAVAVKIDTIINESFHQIDHHFVILTYCTSIRDDHEKTNTSTITNTYYIRIVNRGLDLMRESHHHTKRCPYFKILNSNIWPHLIYLLHKYTAHQMWWYTYNVKISEGVVKAAIEVRVFQNYCHGHKRSMGESIENWRIPTLECSLNWKKMSVKLSEDLENFVTSNSTRVPRKVESGRVTCYC